MNAAIAIPDDGFALSQVTIKDCEPCQLAAFRDLNLAWIRRYFTIEAEDRALLDDPQSGVLDHGGIILIASWSGRDKQHHVIGTCAILRDGDGSALQLAKMAVDERFQGKQIGKLLGRAAIERARQAGASSLRLETNSKLTPAIRLYEKLGFAHMPTRESSYARADVQMVIEL
jgi:ribosomal protein S18 acetylase RimI-like enzyme